MPQFTVPFDKVEALSHRDTMYQIHPEQFKEFYKFSPDLSGLLSALESRSNFPVNRKLLVDELREIYKNQEISDLQESNIDALENEDVYTVITAHQPSLFTGPLYFIIKILSTINLAKTLGTKSGKKIIPVFILGSEDHDFEEINHCHIYGKRIEWQSNQSGPVGRMTLDNFESVIHDFFEILGDSNQAQVVKEWIDHSRKGANNYNEFVFRLVNRLFGKYGVIVGNMDRKALKASFIPHFQKELLTSPSESLIHNTQNLLEKLGFHSQAHAREINLFYLSKGSRNRIIREGELYKVVDTDVVWTEDEIINELKLNPDNFSPNVVMRPLYQEFIWPNLAYVGGGGELAYWLERKSQFEEFGISFPALIRRNSLLLLSSSQKKQWEKLGFKLEELFNAEFELINSYLQDATSFDINLDDEVGAISNLLAKVSEKAEKADKSLKGFAEAESTRMLKQLENIESRIKRSLKKREETSVSKIKKIKSQLFPGQGLQERHDNFFQHFLIHGSDLFDQLLPLLDPLNKEFVVYYPE